MARILSSQFFPVILFSFSIPTNFAVTTAAESLTSTGFTLGYSRFDPCSVFLAIHLHSKNKTAEMALRGFLFISDY